MANHHYVSKFYYKEFTFNPKRSLVYSMGNQGRIRNRHRSFRKIGCEENYNTFEQERAQNRLETRYRKILREFIKTADKEKYDFSNEVIETDKIVYVFSDGFLEFVSFMLGNNIFVRKKLASVYTVDKIVPSGVELNNSNIVMDGGYSGKFDWSVSFSGCVYKELKNWALGLVRLDPETSRSYFITSDNPVSLFNPENIYAPIDLRLKHDESKTKFISNASKDRIDLEVVVTLENVSFGQDVLPTVF